MEAFNRLKPLVTYRLKDLKIGEYALLSLKKIQSIKYGYIVIAKLQVEGQEKEYFLPKHKSHISDEAIDTINAGSYIFVYRGKVDGKYDDCDIKKIGQ
ncbi:hypothetical protein CDAR_522381 [Caerostris darwini]|uniref:Uncharacterized protein n=1 Tax=Caerostris darwini TaxID=1538125 RepID=A0AAV4VPJ8_9ARAC|nr:hypothetical protein CDAR_522381 [Caerostris darwini]